jgi:hypothetical protein
LHVRCVDSHVGPTGSDPPLPAVGEAEPATALADDSLESAVDASRFDAERWEKLNAAPIRSRERRAALAAELDRRQAEQEAAGLGSQALTGALVAKLLAAALAIADAEPTEPEPVPAEEAPSERHPLLDDLEAGRIRPRIRQVGFAPRTGVWTSRTRRNGGRWSPRHVIAVSRPVPRSTSLSLSRSRGPRGGSASRPGARRSSCQPRAPSDDSGSEPGPPPLGAQPGQVAVATGCRGGHEPLTADVGAQVASIVQSGHPREVAPC